MRIICQTVDLEGARAILGSVGIYAGLNLEGNRLFNNICRWEHSK